MVIGVDWGHVGCAGMGEYGEMHDWVWVLGAGHSTRSSTAEGGGMVVSDLCW